MAAFLIPAAIGAVSSGIGAWQAHRGAKKESQAYGKLAQEEEARARAAQAQAAASRNMFVDAARGARDFDPTSYMQSQAGNMMSGLMDQYRQGTNARLANNNSRGVFNSDLGGARMQRNLNENMTNSLAGLSMDAARMRAAQEQQYASAMGGVYGSDQGQQNQFHNSALGLRGAGIEAQALGRQATAGALGQIGGSLIGAAGQAAATSQLPPWMRRR
jgi:hypothetical protein